LAKQKQTTNPLTLILLNTRQIHKLVDRYENDRVRLAIFKSKVKKEARKIIEAVGRVR